MRILNFIFKVYDHFSDYKEAISLITLLVADMAFSFFTAKTFQVLTGEIVHSVIYFITTVSAGLSLFVLQQTLGKKIVAWVNRKWGI